VFEWRESTPMGEAIADLVARLQSICAESLDIAVWGGCLGWKQGLDRHMRTGAPPPPPHLRTPLTPLPQQIEVWHLLSGERQLERPPVELEPWSGLCSE